ncbi:MAG: TonB-dependent receptor [Aureispira sp.]|nr:TonB-dependent receptor [Aureispira sp.]
MKRYLSLFIILYNFWGLQAQNDSSSVAFETGPMDVIVIKAQNFRPHDFAIGNHSEHLPSKILEGYLGSNFADLLSKESSFFVKSYGLGNIATLSGRGGGAGHTAVLWDGFNIQNQMLGQNDLSLFSPLFIDDVTLQYGANSSLAGNSSLGGAIHLNYTPIFAKGWQALAHSSLGSFEDIQQQLKLDYSNKIYNGRLRVLYHQAQNNFKFRDVNAFGQPKPIKKMSNAALEQFSILQENYLRIAQKQIFTLKTWYQNSYREIAPTLLQMDNDAVQRDESLRLSGGWKWLGKSPLIEIKSGLFLERLDYKSSTVDSKSQFLISNNSAKIRIPMFSKEHNHLLSGGLQYNFQTAISSGYSDKPLQHQLSCFLAYKISDLSKTWTVNTSFRQELVDWKFITPAFHLGGKFQMIKNLNLRSSVSHNYRIPSFNDLYWDVLGKPDLKPEYSWNGELGLDYENCFGATCSWISKTELTGYINYVRNWILWSPDPNSGLWRPSNVDKVLSRGLEFSQSLYWKAHQNWVVNFKVQYHLVKSTRIAPTNASLGGKQLIYTPVHNGYARLALNYKKHTKLSYQHNLTSSSFINNENTEVLPLFHLGAVELSHQFSLEKLVIKLYGKVNNVWGADYQVMANRPMPWQQFQVGLIFKYK